MRSFEFAQKDGKKMYENAKLPEYGTANSAGTDFFAVEDITIPSIWRMAEAGDNPQPTLVHTGIKAAMEPDEVLQIYSRSSGPKKLGLVLANSVGIIDADYYGNPDNDGEIMFAFYNLRQEAVTVHAGDKIGQGIFMKFLRPEVNCMVKDVERKGGFGSTGK